MKNIFMLVSYLLLFPLLSLGQTVTTEHLYVQVGETITFTDTNNSWDFTETNLKDIVYIRNSGSTFTLTGVAVGTVPFYTAHKQSYTLLRVNIHVIHVVEVQGISIPSSLDLRIGEEFTFTPLITPLRATTSFAWSSSNAAVASVDAYGSVTATGIGNATITCTSANGVKTQSIVTVSHLPVQSVTLDNQKCELSANETIQLHSSIYPANSTSQNVRWISSNENIAQVDDEGNVTAIASGYCSIYAFANDGSGKFGKCLIHVSGQDSVKGDVDGNGVVNLTDAQHVVRIFVGKEE